jgi:hypothetical protein
MDAPHQSESSQGFSMPQALRLRDNRLAGKLADGKMHIAFAMGVLVATLGQLAQKNSL